MKSQQQAFTLLEVLIALAVIAIAFVALIKASTENSRHLQRMEQHMLARLVANQVLNSCYAGMVPVCQMNLLPIRREVKKTTRMGRYPFPWKLQLLPTQEHSVVAIIVIVYNAGYKHRILQMSSQIFQSGHA